MFWGFAGAEAQTQHFKPEIAIGLHGGYGVSEVNFSPTVDQDLFQGYTAGLIFNYINEKTVGLQIELNYVQKGWTEVDNLYTRHLNYIELPFMTHIYMGKKARFFLNMGPQISYLLSENTTINTTSDSNEQHIRSVQNPFEYGLCGGIGFNFRIKQQVFQLESRVQYSMSDIFSNAKVDYFDTSNNIGANVTFAWLMQLGHKK